MIPPPLPKGVEASPEGITWSVMPRGRSPMDKLWWVAFVASWIVTMATEMPLWTYLLPLGMTALLFLSKDRVRITARQLTVRRTGPLRWVAPDLELPLAVVEAITVNSERKQPYSLVFEAGDRTVQLTVYTSERDEVENLAAMVRERARQALPASPTEADRQALADLERLQGTHARSQEPQA